MTNEPVKIDPQIQAFANNLATQQKSNLVLDRLDSKDETAIQVEAHSVKVDESQHQSKSTAQHEILLV